MTHVEIAIGSLRINDAYHAYLEERRGDDKRMFISIHEYNGADAAYNTFMTLLQPLVGIGRRKETQVGAAVDRYAAICGLAPLDAYPSRRRPVLQMTVIGRDDDATT